MLLTIGKPLYKPVSIPTVNGNATLVLVSDRERRDKCIPLEGPRVPCPRLGVLEIKELGLRLLEPVPGMPAREPKAAQEKPPRENRSRD